MEEEKKNLEFTNEKLIDFLHTQRKLACMEEYYLTRKDLLDRVMRVLDLEENETSTPMVAKLRTDEILGNEVGESRENIRRYIRLTYLIPELLEQVDLKRIAFRPAVELSYLSEENQYVVQDIFEFDEVTPSLSQAIRLKKLEQKRKLTEEKIEEFIRTHNEKIEKYIPTKIKESFFFFWVFIA